MQEELYEPCSRTNDFYKLVTTYNEDDRLVESYQKDGDCDSEEK